MTSSAVLIKYPGVLASTAGLKRVMTYDANGFPNQRMQACHLFTDGSGTAAADSLGGSSGLIEAPAASNNAYSWMSGGGGLQLDGSQIVSFGAFDITQAWTMVYLGAVTGSVGGTGSERITALLGFRNWATADVRGAITPVRTGGNDWNTGTPQPLYQARPANGSGGSGAISVLSPSANLNIIGSRRALVLSWDGSSQLTAAVYDKNGNTLTSVEVTTSNTVLTTGTGGAVVTSLQPIIGGPTAAYSGGRQQVEGFLRYKGVLNATEIAGICAAASALGTARGRAW